ncbi:MAG: hypothetical protein O7H39_08680, partial [Gammaproteobacteria bacterium]|nr:hypothetical protein [Gammaproteobacteria bacterium]
SMQLEVTVASAEIIVLALPSGVVLTVLDDLLPYLRASQDVLVVTKGLGPDNQLITDAIEFRLTEAKLSNTVAGMLGPTIAPELAAGVITTAQVTSGELIVAERLAKSLSTSTLLLVAGDDPTGAELWGAFKNVVALACGVVDGLPTGGGENLKASIFASGYREGCGLLGALGAAPATALGPAGLGDLYVTATSRHGRNRAMGEQLGSGLTLEQASRQTVMVSEGVRATRMFAARAAAESISAPFVDAVNALLDGRFDAQTFVASVLDPALHEE